MKGKKEPWEQFEMKAVHLLTEAKLELNNLIHITVPYWLHLWVSLLLHETYLQDPFQAAVGHMSGVKHWGQRTMCSPGPTARV